MSATNEDRKATTAATLRQMAGWGFEWSHTHENAGDDLHQLADAVEAMAEDDPTCPVCEETLCDEDCPFVGIRIYERGDQ